MEMQTKAVGQKFQIYQFCERMISYIKFTSKVDIKKFSTATGGGYLDRFFFCETK